MVNELSQSLDIDSGISVNSFKDKNSIVEKKSLDIMSDAETSTGNGEMNSFTEESMTETEDNINDRDFNLSDDESETDRDTETLHTTKRQQTKTKKSTKMLDPAFYELRRSERTRTEPVRQTIDFSDDHSSDDYDSTSRKKRRKNNSSILFHIFINFFLISYRIILCSVFY